MLLLAMLTPFLKTADRLKVWTEVADDADDLLFKVWLEEVSAVLGGELHLAVDCNCAFTSQATCLSLLTLVIFQPACPQKLRVLLH